MCKPIRLQRQRSRRASGEDWLLSEGSDLQARPGKRLVGIRANEKPGNSVGRLTGSNTLRREVVTRHGKERGRTPDENYKR